MRSKQKDPSFEGRVCIVLPPFIFRCWLKVDSRDRNLNRRGDLKSNQSHAAGL